MNGKEFVHFVDRVFGPFLKNMGFLNREESISGRYYRVSFASQRNAVSISFEPGDSMLLILVFTVRDGALSAIDDRNATPRSSDLNAAFMRYVSDVERGENEAEFAGIEATGPTETSLLKAAKELRLVLPKYLAKAN